EGHGAGVGGGEWADESGCAGEGVDAIESAARAVKAVEVAGGGIEFEVAFVDGGGNGADEDKCAGGFVDGEKFAGGGEAVDAGEEGIFLDADEIWCGGARIGSCAVDGGEVVECAAGIGADEGDAGVGLAEA